jgi:SAM-dependent methyltransferase
MTLDTRLRFYKQVVARVVSDRDARILIVAGGPRDMLVFRELGFTNVVISNLDSRADAAQFAPYEWSYQDAEDLSYEDGAFDYTVVHAALHHCHSPHRALLEMYRVAKRGVLGFESRDSLLMRMFERFRLTQVYEHAAVFHNDCAYGGVRNSEIPNFIYRWTEREVEKTIRSYAPHAVHEFAYFYGHDTPVTPGLERGAAMKRLAVAVLRPAYELFSLMFPRQQNLFAFSIRKPTLPTQLHPWLTWQDGAARFNAGWARARYR